MVADCKVWDKSLYGSHVCWVSQMFMTVLADFLCALIPYMSPDTYMFIFGVCSVNYVESNSTSSPMDESRYHWYPEHIKAVYKARIFRLGLFGGFSLCIPYAGKVLQKLAEPRSNYFVF